MGILDDINNMRNQGVSDREISMRLQEKGASPRIIEDAFNQLRIKKAVSAEYSGEEGMEPSIMNENHKYDASPPAPIPSSLYIPKTQEIGHESEELYAPAPIKGGSQSNEAIESPAMYGTEYPQEEYYPQEMYGTDQGGGVYDTDTLIEIAEQVFSEKIKKEQKELESLKEFATLVETRITNDHERIKRMEEIIDKLQVAILEKIGSYGRNLESIKNEMGMMQESFEKMIPSLQGGHHKHEQLMTEEPAEEEIQIHHPTKKRVSRSRK